jgi:light-regulated signal transduction histidine kinase (bacteriophytochrome)
LKRAVEQLEAFSYTVAHDLSAPVANMNSFSQILLEEHSQAMPPEAVNMLERVKTSAERMDRLIRDLLDYSRLGRMDISSQECRWRASSMSRSAISRKTFAGKTRTFLSGTLCRSFWAITPLWCMC